MFQTTLCDISHIQRRPLDIVTFLNLTGPLPQHPALKVSTLSNQHHRYVIKAHLHDRLLGLGGDAAQYFRAMFLES